MYGIYGMACQAAIQATTLYKPGPGHYLIDRFRELMDEVRDTQGEFTCKIAWTPGHCGIDGNEKADTLAKKAAQGQSSHRRHLPKTLRKPLPASKSALKQHYRSKLEKKALKYWRKSQRHARAAKIDPTMPSDKFLTLVQNLNRRQTSLLLQLRTGHIALNQHLHRINKAPSPICTQCGLENETVLHFLLKCPERHNEQERALGCLGRAGRSLTHLLTKKEALKPLFRYIHYTQRLQQIFRDVTIKPP
jgi:hypothetical protein